MSIIFNWKQEDLENRLATCGQDEVCPLVYKYFQKGSKILEAGCGDGRWVKYLNDNGWSAVGLEISHETIEMVSRVWPEVKIIQGDAANSPFDENYFDGVISLGVVEHWLEGPAAPLKDIFRVLKPGGVAIITVPCFNTIRKLKKLFCWNEVVRFPRALTARLIKGRKLTLNRFKKDLKFNVFPTYGKFFEYRMTTEEFLGEIRRVGFEIVEHLPIATIDGIYHEINPFGLILRFKNWKFEISALAKKINQILGKWTFFHPHMQGVVVRKSLGSNSQFA